MNNSNKRYQAYLLRLWRVRQGEHDAWRASLEDTHTGERRGFPSLEALVEFLRGLLQEREEDLSTRQLH